MYKMTNRWRRCVFALALIPLAYAAICLARLPQYVSSMHVSDDGKYVLTFYPSGVDEEVTDFQVLSLRTGQSMYLRARYRPKFENGGLYWCDLRDGRTVAKYLDLDSFREKIIGDIERGPPHAPCSLISPGVLATVNKENELCVIDLQSGAVASHPLPPLRASASHFWFLFWLESSQRLLVSEESNGRTAGNERQVLFSYTNGKLTPVGEWKASSTPTIAEGHIYSLTINHSLEIRRIDDGALVAIQSMAEKLNLRGPGLAFPLSVWISGSETGRVFFGARRNRYVLYDYVNKQVVTEDWVPGKNCWDFDHGKAIYAGDQVVEIGFLDPAAPLQRIELAQQLRGAKFIDGNQHVVVLLEDDSVHIYDTTSGKRIQTYRDRTWERPTFMALLIGFFAWGSLWVRDSVRNEVHPLWDVVVLNALVLTGLLLRVFLQGSVRDPTRPVYQYLQALGASWLMLVVLWFVFGKSRWSIKAIAPLMGLVAILLLALFVYRGNRQQIMELLIGAVVIIAVMCFVLGLARRWGWRLSNIKLANRAQPLELAESRIPLRDMFLITAAIGFLLALARLLPAHGFRWDTVGILALLVINTSLSAVGGAWAALSPRHWFVRTAMFVLLVLLVGSVHSLVFPQFYNLYSWKWQLRFAALVIGFSCLSLLTFRVRGWRLTRAEVRLGVGPDVMRSQLT
jgi:hypothetical protein